MSSTNETDPSHEGFTSRILQSGIFIDKFYTPLLCLFGALGNSLSLAVFCMDSKYRSQSSSYYLSALAVSDTGFLLNLFAVWLEGVHSGVITSDAMCPLVMYLGQVTCFISVYLTVAFSIERYVAVHYPFSRPRICTRSKAKKGILAVTVISMLLFSYVWFIAKVVEVKSPSSSSSLSSSTENCLNYSESKTSTSKNKQWKTEETANFTTSSSNSMINYTDYQITLESELTTTRISLVDDHPTAEEYSFETKEVSHLYDYQNDTSLIWNRSNNGDGTGAPETDPFWERRANMESRKWHNNDKNINGNRSIKTAQGNNKFDMERQQRQRLDYFHLIDGKSGIQQQQQESDKKFGTFFSSGNSTQKNIISFTTPVTPDSQENVLAFLNITGKNELNHKTNQNCGTFGRSMCTVPERYHKISEITNYLDTAVTLIIPFLLITYFNVRISMSVWKLKDQRQQIVASPSAVINKASTLVVVPDNRSGRHSSLTKIVNFNHLGSPQYHNCARDDDLCENGICQWHERCNAHFQDTSPGACRCTGGANNSLIRGNCSDIALNKTHDAMPSLTSTFPLLHTRGSCGGSSSGSIVRRSFSSIRRGERPGHPSHHYHPSSEVRVTKTLLLVSTMFLLLNLPLHVIRCTQFFQSVTGTKEGKDILRALQPWANLLFNTNFAVNFLLYCASGRNFRKSLRHIASRTWRRTPKPLQQNSSHFYHHHHRQSSGHDAGGKKRKWWSRQRRGSAAERIRNNSQYGNPTITTVIKGPPTTEFFELEPIVADNMGSHFCVYVAGNSNLNGENMMAV